MNDLDSARKKTPEDLSRRFTNIIPNEIDSEIKLSRRFSAKDLFFIVTVFIIFASFQNAVHIYFRPFYFAFLVVASIILLSKSNRVPNKKIGMVVYSSLRRDRNIYHPIENMRVDNKVMEKTSFAEITNSAAYREKTKSGGHHGEHQKSNQAG